jgi:prepilin-type N-terminal cleavage/methylation domain-containing protein
MDNFVRRRRAFTMVEIMIVVLIIAIICEIAIPNFIIARNTSWANACVENLREIEAAKEEWAMVKRQGPTASPGSTDLVGTATTGFMKSFPACPAGGTYTIGNMQTRPACSVAGHALS